MKNRFSYAPAMLALLLAVHAPENAFAQDWRADAEARIDTHRKANLRVVVRDVDGTPIEGANVAIDMQGHAFRFGTAVQSHLARFEPRDDLLSGDLDLGESVVGVRFALQVPQGATIQSAFLQFTADKDDQDEGTELSIRASASDDAPDFDVTGIRSRELTTASAAWDVPSWPRRGDQTAAQRSPDIRALVQEVVDRDGWEAGHHIAFILHGSGKRSAQTFDQDSTSGATLHVVIEEGSADSGVQASADDAEQITADFYGTDAERYREEIQRLFNYATPENALKWRPWERDRKLADGTIEWLRSHDIAVRGHAMIWSSWRWNAIPVDVEARTDNPTFVSDRAAGHVARIASAYEGQILDWDVVNEPLHEGDLEQIVGFGERIRWFQAARENDTFARLFVNDFDVLENDVLLERYKRLVRDLTNDGAQVDGIGIQGHFLGQPVSPEDLVRRYASLAELGLPLQITEFDMSSGWSATAQREFMETILVTSFAEPAVSAFIMWGFWDGNHWLGNAPLYTRDWTLKPSGEVFMDYVFDRWWTSASEVTDMDGAADIRGFKGTYDVTASFNGHVETQRVSLLDDYEIVLDLDQVRVSSEAAASIDAGIRSVYPIPFKDVLNIKAATSTATDVRFEMHDLLGRLVWSSELRTLPAGEHEVRLSPDVRGSGTYLLQMHGWVPGGSFVASKFVVVVR